MTEPYFFGNVFAVNRYRAHGYDEWRFHSTYKGAFIERAYLGGKPKALYRAVTKAEKVDDLMVITATHICVGESLAAVKKAVSEYDEEYLPEGKE